MKTVFLKNFISWNSEYMTDASLVEILDKPENARHAYIKRLLKSGDLIHLKRGLYRLGQSYQKKTANLFELSQLLYGPSYVSLESALSYHQWIPEAVYTITNASFKRSCAFQNTLGFFTYRSVPKNFFYVGVDRIEEDTHTFFMANPWRALADCLYVYKKTWHSLKAVISDLRLNEEQLYQSNTSTLKILANNYGHKGIQALLKTWLKEM